jgi:hypothetical protein
MTVSLAVVLVELGAISWICHHYLDTPLVSAIFQVSIRPKSTVDIWFLGIIVLQVAGRAAPPAF